MANKWLDITEVVVGMILEHRINPNAVDPGDLMPPYDTVLRLARDGKDRAGIAASAGLSLVHNALAAAATVNGELSPAEWLTNLRRVATRSKAGIELKKQASALENGDDVDVGDILRQAMTIDIGHKDMTPLNEITPQDVVWVETGYEPIDKHLGGIPGACLTLLAASPGIGKTTLLLRIIRNMIKKYKDKKVAFFTLEMLMSQIAMRMIQVDTSMTKAEKSRVLVNDSVYTVDGIYALASRCAATENLSLIAIDFADLMVDGEQSEAMMGNIYRSLSVLAKRTGIPVLLITQLNRATYFGGVPKINHIRYSGMAEIMAALILLLYNPHNILADYSTSKESGNVLDVIPGKGYIIAGKSRFGFKEGGPGGILVPWSGETGWGSKSDGYFTINT